MGRGRNGCSGSAHPNWVRVASRAVTSRDIALVYSIYRSLDSGLTRLNLCANYIKMDWIMRSNPKRGYVALLLVEQFKRSVSCEVVPMRRVRVGFCYVLTLCQGCKSLTSSCSQCLSSALFLNPPAKPTAAVFPSRQHAQPASAARRAARLCVGG